MDEHQNGVPVLTMDEVSLDGLRQAYDGSTSREQSLQRQASRWFIVALVSGLGLVGVSLWDHLDRRERVEAFVQPIRVTDEGQVTLIEPPKRMQDYVVPAEAVQYMLVRFVVDLRRLSKDEVDQEDRRRHVDAAVCGPAAQQVLLPPVREAALVAINIEGALPTESKRTYRVSWRETWTDKLGNALSEHLMIGDFTMHRRDLDFGKKDSMATYLRNPMSLCVSSYVIHEVP